MRTPFYVSWLLGCLAACRPTDAPVPYQFDDTPGAGRFSAAVRRATEGVYGVSDGVSQFGEQVVLKWSFLVNGTDTSYYLSAFSPLNAGIILLEPNPNRDSLSLTGYWRTLTNTNTGLARLALRVRRNGQLRALAGGLSETDTLVLSGTFGNNQNAPTRALTLTYRRPLNSKPFAILAHRSGGRTSDFLPASENSVNMIKLASRLGATGIEVDVRFTKDGVPILYHDNTLNLRLIQKNGLVGDIENYTYAQLSGMVRLINGEPIPTLMEALDAVIANTNLNFVWLDTKFVSNMETIQAIQATYRQRAAERGRQLEIVIGLPSQTSVDLYRALPNRDNTPALCELDTAVVRSLNARIWAPRWTLGPQTEEVRAMQAEGRRVFVWTLDEADFIEEFINQGRFDGILSNYSSVVAYYHYVGQ